MNAFPTKTNSECRHSHLEDLRWRWCAFRWKNLVYTKSASLFYYETELLMKYYNFSTSLMFLPRWKTTNNKATWTCNKSFKRHIYTRNKIRNKNKKLILSNRFLQKKISSPTNLSGAFQLEILLKITFFLV